MCPLEVRKQNYNNILYYTLRTILCIPTRTIIHIIVLTSIVYQYILLLLLLSLNRTGRCVGEGVCAIGTGCTRMTQRATVTGREFDGLINIENSGRAVAANNPP